MGLLVEGKALLPEEMKEKLRYIRIHGVQQFINNWKKMKDLEDDELKFGDEIECGIFAIDKEKKTVKISMRAFEIKENLIEKENEFLHEAEGSTWHPEYGAWMIESTPSRPYTGYASDLLRVERNMILRRRRLISALNENEIAPTVTCFPLLGVGDFILDPLPFEAPYSQSIYVPDYIINPHPRFAALTRNIRERRGSKVDIRVPLYRDLKTPEFYDNPLVNLPEGFKLENTPEIHMDAMAFGMGMCCLQVTFQARDVCESRYMYDQLAVLAPIMMAMTAATPIFKGRLADIDCRWTVISQSVDDRTEAERGLLSAKDALAKADPRLAGSGIKLIPKSRYDTVSTYIYHCRHDPSTSRTNCSYNDIECPVDEEIKEMLRTSGVDENLSHHIAHLFTRDPIVAFNGKIEELDDETSTDHFESIQSTNWQSCRWKPPPMQNSPTDPHIGWRTEFRSMEAQLTDFENAAFTVFTVLITRVMLAFDLSLYIPLSRVDENMKRAHQRDAINSQKFFFRRQIAPPEVHSSPLKKKEAPSDSENEEHCCCEEMTMAEIFLGKGDYYPGLLPLVHAYLEYINCDTITMNRLNEYLQFIERRATGEIQTPATWIREFVTSHPDYNQDSVVSQSIAYDLLVACQNIGEGKVPCPELLGDIKIERIRKEDAYGQILAGKLTSSERFQLIQKLLKRTDFGDVDHKSIPSLHS